MGYTLLSLLWLGASVYLVVKARPNARKLAIAASVCIFFQLIFDNLMTWAGLWIFDPGQVLGIWLPFIPIENLAFGLALMFATVAFWELGKSV
ncbi:MAG: lycopene cyclase domain-containing protein [Candidatus Anstonellaceae archaeon]